ncbi:MAG: thiazole synthase [Alphaproteobacteria bacterium]|jgi:thiazole synthase|nr:thiazole synthase [Alphaproteobacteria bacterium]PPR13227.1 MAG: Thiazole synthase [Alphaproteobacteria bacterium MarineAlpha12_Bin1]|tara:strand:+ start:23099 stop:23869 length:771 start_codon:yes stop_codon:yes gene_type:complete
MSDLLEIAGENIKSRLWIGTAGYPNQQIMLDSLKASGAEVITVSIRRISLDTYNESMIDIIGNNYRLLPNTSGCSTAKDAVLTAQLSREALETNWIKLELIGDRDTLYPDSTELISAAKELVKDGFKVFPYCTDDPVSCQKLEDLGCVSVMPLGSPIGSGMGICNPYNIEMICNHINIPVVLDAGVGTASDATLAMELGCEAVLLNSAVSKAANPVLMASAMREAVSAGRKASISGRIPKLDHAVESSPRLGLIGS